ncbi:hypothetical protein NQ317_012195 [Molorchus minor]|uniref:Uncharacterized protein n=1 Tax=Molorchus minor TaxID=1323400 RepID=A0ABQ9K3E3_9CUCU|nr:hypothetical protein NQ317_012195 [Molorchus minor]
MHNAEESSNSMCKNLVESSTDSGICRSTEIVVVPTAMKDGANEDGAHRSCDNNSDTERNFNGIDNKTNISFNFGKLHIIGDINLEQRLESKRYAVETFKFLFYARREYFPLGTTSVKQMANTFNQEDKGPCYNNPPHEKLTQPWEKFTNYRPSDWSNPETELKSTTITIPIIKNNNIVDLLVERRTRKDIKRHSIAVDESKYVTKNTNENRFEEPAWFQMINILKDDDDANFNRKPKR